MLPVNETLATSGCWHKAAPTSPSPWITFKTPFGNPASDRISAKSELVLGVKGDGLYTNVLPQMSAGSVFHAILLIGKFHAPIPEEKQYD